MCRPLTLDLVKLDAAIRARYPNVSSYEVDPGGDDGSLHVIFRIDDRAERHTFTYAELETWHVYA